MASPAAPVQAGPALQAGAPSARNYSMPQPISASCSGPSPSPFVQSNVLPGALDSRAVT
eukprot:CAMPEP_0195103116 /NCGR_PEP_ID=MMETSP0448-20130528/71018_1 /TAXON_ID=66468 /ORGANISM="Heterocapsa triquestra, Strain CCMP 448" /LENGTH=58 /DNA_ID=CAMNT_0040138729 /DNA_START=175 /DNA_END=347 /DNA_ORIENTATION=+